MILNDYFEKLGEGIEFLIAIGSIIGLFGIIISILALIVISKYYQTKVIFVLVISIILLCICGFDTGLKYFGMY
ncbi:MAG: hypothetical protein KGD57_02125 [Candidatus Lokiarchaeota archaeon]|nr:hypothetical protein [Candidatus Lokiarchaeota archaeon]